MKRSVVFLFLVPFAASAERADWADDPAPTPAAATSTADAAPAAGALAPTAPAGEVSKVDAKPVAITAITTPEQLASMSGFSIGASLDHSLGAGTFICPDRCAGLWGAVDLNGAYAFSVASFRLRASLREVVSYEYTLPDNPTGRRWTWRDLRLGLSAPAIYKESFTGISMTPSISATVPITLESWQATTITVLGFGLNFTRSVGLFDFALAVSGSRGFHVSPINAVRANDRADAQGTRIYFNREGSNLSDVYGTNTAWGVAGSLSVDFRATEALSFSASYALRAGWKYAIASDPNDPYNCHGSNVDGQSPCTVGAARAMDLVTTSVSANYQLSDHWAASLYIQTEMPPLTDDGHAVRFPFWAFEGAANNYSNLGLSLAANF